MSRTGRCVSCGQGRHQGFTLIELMITVAVVAILTALALPSYQDYVLRGRLVDATTALSSLRARMEQYYQDNRTYKSVSKTIVSPCANSSMAGTFTVSCPTLEDTSYLLQAKGAGSTVGFVFTMDNSGTQATTGLPKAWGEVPKAGYACWIAKKGGTC
ncbi:MAG: hypothetical protein A2W72_16830 [Burkholderiales bacterium RIFCSPLOWO2_12_67_14]|nr:MAG: hypothetical protein A3I64_02510 [Burkholderiales bacterium RIFCSPLOWO2_02_FULL_67_64]OGB42751.1 MAG: hypothetical protein A2W72_16830 [Burkholderiales bacterium RIFCSPLOWO2_12_67_14]OGB51491.1 MAG: hypothetical protein A3E51_26230 [Burkholderiales bacterium RIFCSPHIGHO2_12_FULL_67_38]OGB94053.1 MAG: hypothetical protein A3G82_19185 [Burkholderiales bacterium RIFCSPLOWO2_12_FULL_67_210]